MASLAAYRDILAAILKSLSHPLAIHFPSPNDLLAIPWPCRGHALSMTLQCYYNRFAISLPPPSCHLLVISFPSLLRTHGRHRESRNHPRASTYVSETKLLISWGRGGRVGGGPLSLSRCCGRLVLVAVVAEQVEAGRAGGKEKAAGGCFCETGRE